MPSRRRPPRILIGASVVALVLVAGYALLQTPWARAKILTAALAQIAPDGAVRASSLRYSLPQLRFELRDLEMFSPGRTQPYFTADRLAVRLAWSALRGEPALREVEFDGPRFTVRVEPDGSSNFEGEAMRIEGRVRLDRLALRDLEIAWDDAAAGWSLHAGAIDLLVRQSDRAGSSLRAGEPAILSYGDRELAIEQDSGALGWNGLDLLLHQLRFTSAPADMAVDGSIDELMADRRLDLRLQAALRVPELVEAAGTAAEELRGEIAIDATARGPALAPEIVVQAHAPELGWARIELREVEVGVRVADDVTIERARAGLAGGRVTASGRIALQPGGASFVQAEWTDLSPAQLAAAAEAASMPAVAGRLAGSARIAWTGTVPAALEAVEAELRAELTPAPGPGVPLQGMVQMHARDGRWRLDGDVAAAALGRLRVHELAGGFAAGSELAGRLEIELPDLDAAATTVARIRPDLLAAAPRAGGSARFEGRLSGTLGAPVLAGAAALSRVSFEGSEPFDLEAGVEIAPARLGLTDVLLHTAAGTVRGAAALEPASGAVTGSIASEALDLHSLRRMVPAGLLAAELPAVSGRLSFDLELRGALPVPDVSGVARIEQLIVPGYEPLELRARLSKAPFGTRIDELVATAGTGRVQASGVIGPGAKRVDLIARVVLDDPAGALGRPELAGVGAARAELGIGIDLEAGSLVADLWDLDVDLGRSPLRVVEPGRVTWDAAGLRVEDLGITIGDALLSVEGALGHEPGQAVVLRLDGELAELEEAATVAWTALQPEGAAAAEAVRLDGSLQARVEIAGTLERPEPSGSVDLTGGRIQLPGLPPVEGLTVRAEIDPRALRLIDVRLQVGGTSVTALGELPLGLLPLPGEPAPVQGPATLRVRFADLTEEILADWLPAQQRGALQLRASGQLDLAAPELRVDAARGSLVIDQLTVGSSGIRFVQLRPTRLTLESGTLRIADWDWVSSPWWECDGSGYATKGADARRLDAGDALPHRQGEPTQQMRPWWRNPPGKRGLRAMAALRLLADGARHRLVAAPCPRPQDPLARPTTLPPRAAGDPAQGAVDATRLELAGTVELTGDGTLDLEARGDLRLAPLGAFMPGGSIDGRAILALRVTGTMAAPAPEGTIELRGVGARFPSPRMVLGGLSGTLAFRDGRLTADGVAGTLNGGDLLLSVDASLLDPASPSGTVGITGRGVPFEAAGVRINTDIDITVSAAGPQMRALGSITVLEGGYRSRRTLAGELRSAMAGTTAGPTAEPSALSGLLLDVRVRSADQLIVDTTFAQLGVELDLRVLGTAARPGATGRMQLEEGGRIFLNGVTYSLERGVIEFSDPTRIAPRLDLRASTRIDRYEVDLTLTGDAFAPTVTATSEPQLTEADVLSLMATGRTMEQAGSEGSQIAREQAFAMLTGQLQGVTRSLGIDTVRLEQRQRTAENPFLRPDETDLFPRTTDLSTRLTLTRRFGSRFELAFSQNLGETGGQSWIGTLELPRNIQLRAGTFDDSTRTAELRHRLVFGAAPEAAARAEPAQVTEIRFSGDTVVPHERLRERLRLRAGERFDFLDWQRDQDRLRRLYLEEGYREARVRARRETVGRPRPDGRPRRVALVYEVASGPPTRLSVSSPEIDSAAVREMEAAWADALATDFLLADLEEIARRRLAQRGYLEPEVRAVVVSETPLKEIRVEVETGSRVAGMRVELAGNTGISDGAIRARLRLEDALDALWVNPEPALAAIAALYRENGWLRATASAGEPEHTAAGARITVRIDEGPAFLLGRLELEGNTELDDVVLQGAAAGLTGRRFTPELLDEAVGAVIGAYHEAAFNAARVDPVATIDEDAATVTLRLRIEEGARHVLREIAVEGRHRTRASVVERALGLRIGQPLGLREVERIRRRLYEAGAFRSVNTILEEAGPAQDGAQPVRLRISLIELPSFEIRYGVQLLDLEAEQGPLPTAGDGRERKPGLSGVVTHRNLLGIGASASLLGRGRTDEVFGRGTLSFPRLLGLPVRTTLIAQQARRDLDIAGTMSVRRIESELQLHQSAPLGAHVSLGYTLGFERAVTIVPDSEFPAIPDHVVRLSPSAIYDSRDDLFSPRRGLFHSSTLEVAPEFLGSDLRFIKYSARQYAFVPWRGVVLASAIRFGAGHSLDPASDSLPRSEFFQAGGSTTVRGYPDDSLGRTPFFGSFFPGGDAVLVLNQEVRFPIRGWIHGVAFADAGSTFTSLQQLSLDRLAYSLGAGLRLVTPYVVLRLDYGIRLSDVEGREDLARGRFHFGIGHVF